MFDSHLAARRRQAARATTRTTVECSDGSVADDPHFQSRIQNMRRWVLTFLLLVVPFQFVWGAAAPYCAHEASVAAQKHFGHHEHEHAAEGGIQSASDDDANGTTGAYHADCESCHLGCSAFTLEVRLAVEAPPHDSATRHHAVCYDSHIPSGPHRPDRTDSTPAARFGGGVLVVSLAD